ncbi:MAG: tannase/feruloyl esterase family alpha/beta hydrolase [Gammaproteobacteria bacterium]|nr:tannase/feruloyl esterase family alpha/beta hydrolase [Gammaproteobacteria bacterium]
MKQHLVRSIALAAVLCGGAPAGAAGAAPAATRGLLPAATCESLRDLQLAHTQIAIAEPVAAGAYRPPAQDFPFPADYSNLPAFCRVAGSIHPSADSDIRFELWLPHSGWNGRFMQTGNGGAAGSIIYSSLVEPLARGYAVANTDTGHEGGMGDFAWATGHPEKLTDYAHRAVHELTVAGKALTTAYYGKAPAKAYWYGCSTGGRQGLKAAQRYPQDYDAVIAGAPANNWSPLMALSILTQNNLSGPDALGLDKLPMLKEAAIAACDAGDGVQDRVIAVPGVCRFDPASLLCRAGASRQCLSATEVAAAQRIYRGVVDRSGRTRIPGTGPASEPAWAGYATPQFSIGSNYFRNVVAGDAAWDPHSFDVDRDLARAERADGGAADAMDPDLAPFLARGGRLILYHGTTDGLIPYGNSVNYYEAVRRKLGARRTRNGVRFYLVPGMEHCSLGDGAYQIDWLGAMEQWVERARPPGALPATHPAVAPPNPMGPPTPPGKAFTRPACPYPLVARYSGRGDDRDAASYLCAAAR